MKWASIVVIFCLLGRTEEVMVPTGLPTEMESAFTPDPGRRPTPERVGACDRGASVYGVHAGSYTNKSCPRAGGAPKRRALQVARPTDTPPNTLHYPISSYEGHQILC